MGNSPSARERRVSKAIDKDLGRDKRQTEKIIKLLLLGPYWCQ
jgi:sulfur relay (sulfurtransferase) DsrC/TusE family protein